MAPSKPAMNNKMNNKKIISLYPYGKTKAVTFSYDDGNNADRRLIEIFNKNHLKGTFHLNSGRMTPEQLSCVSDVYAGHEVALHGYNHLFSERSCHDIQLYEFMQDRMALEKACNCAIRGLSYPFGTWNSETLDILKSLGVIYARTTLATNRFSLPEDWLRWHPTGHHSHNIIELSDRFLQTNYELSTLYIWGHSYEFDKAQNLNNPHGNWKMMEEFCEKISGHDELWYATNIEIYDYVHALNNLFFTMDLSQVTNPMAQSVWLKINDVVKEIPGGITVRL